MIIRFSNHGNPFLCKSTSCSSLRAPTRNPFNIGKILGIPGQARDDGRWTIFLNSTQVGAAFCRPSFAQ